MIPIRLVLQGTPPRAFPVFHAKRKTLSVLYGIVRVHRFALCVGADPNQAPGGPGPGQMGIHAATTSGTEILCFC